MKVITIDRRNFLRGFSTSQWVDDGGFSPQSKGFEVSQTGLKGVLLMGRTLNEASTNIADNVIAATKYASGATFIYYVLGNAGKIYTTDPVGTPTHTLKTTDSVKTYNSNSDIIIYENQLFASSTTDVLMSDLAFSAVDNDWWTATKGKTALTSGVVHKFFTYQGILYFTDGNKIHEWNGTTATYNRLTLPTGWIITDVEIANNNIYIAASYGAIELSKNVPTKIFVWNGYSDSWIREININESTITFMQQIGGMLYFSAGRSLFVSDGYNYKRIPNSPAIYAKNFHAKDVYDGVLYFAGSEGENGITAYDTVTGAFSHPVYTTVTINVILIGYNWFIDVYAATNKFYQGNNNTTGKDFYSNWYDLGTPHFIRQVDILFGDPLTSGATYDFLLYNETQTAKHTQTVSYALDGGIYIKTYKLNILANRLQLKMIATNANNKAIHYIKIYAEPSEQHTNK